MSDASCTPAAAATIRWRPTSSCTSATPSTHIDRQLADLQAAFVERSAGDLDVVVPGYTHLQRAQPVLVVHYWLAYCEKFAARPRAPGRLPQAGEHFAAGGRGAGRNVAPHRPRIFGRNCWALRPRPPTVSMFPAIAIL